MPLPSPTDDDAALFAVVARPWGEAGRQAMTILFQRHAPDLRAFLGRLGAGRDGTADDCVQEAFVTAFELAERFQGGSARPWLIAIATRKLAARRRSDRRRLRRERERAGAGNEAEVGGPARDGTELDLEAQIQSLPPRQRAVLELRFIQSLPHAEVAAALGVSLRTAKAWAHDALEALRARVEATGGPR